MDQDDIMDFKALRAKFQEEELLLRQPRARPVLPEKPQAAPPPQSPTYHLPAGARPSILTSINLPDSRTAVGAPRVVFKDDKNSSGWTPLIPALSPKTATKSGNAKTKAGKDKDKSAKPGKDKPDGEDKDASKPKSSKDKKGLLLFKTKESPELVPAPAPAKGTMRKIVFPTFKKTSKRGSMDLNPILDLPSPYAGVGPAPLVPLVGDGPPELPAAAIPDYHGVAALMPPAFIPVAPPSGAVASQQTPSVDDALEPAAAAAAWQEAVSPWKVDPAPAPAVPTTTPAPPLPVSAVPRPATPPSARPPAPTTLAPPLPVSAVPPPATPPSARPPTPSSPAPDLPPPVPHRLAPPSATGAVVESEPHASTVVGSASSSPRMARLSSALERAAEKTTGKRTNPADQRILQALEKARRKFASPPTPLLLSPPLEDFLPPMDYEGPGNPDTAHLNGFDNSASEEGLDALPALMVVPPPQPRRALPDLQVLGPPPPKPARPPNVNLSPYLPPPLEETPALPESWDQGEASDGLPEFEDTGSLGSQTPAGSEAAWGNGDYSVPNGHVPGMALPDAGPSVSSGVEDRGLPALASVFATPGLAAPQDALDSSTLSVPDNWPDSTPQLGNSGNFYEDVNVSTTKKKAKDGLKKHKGSPKNPYDETQQPTSEEKSKTIRLGNFRTEKKPPAEGPDEKELKKREKQRLEKEKKELKEQKEREKREQKEKGKKESDMKKRFNITGQEEAMYQAVVTVTTKGRKDDLPVTDGENISIIRTTKCPKGKWLARNNSNTYGYISVDHVKLDIQEMMQMGRKPSSTKPFGSSSSSSVVDGGAAAVGSRQHAEHYPESTGSFTDDSDEWTGDEEDPLTPTNPARPFPPQSHTRTRSMDSMPDTDGNQDLGPVHLPSDLSTQDPPTQARHEALNKLATFFRPVTPEEEPTTSSAQEESSHAPVEEQRLSTPEATPTEEEGASGDISDLLILPPPAVFADTEPETSM